MTECPINIFKCGLHLWVNISKKLLMKLSTVGDIKIASKMLLIVLSMVVTILILYNAFIDWFNVRWRNHPPGPMSLPLVGGAWALNPAHMPQQLLKMSQKFGDIISVRVGFQGHIVFLNSLNAINSVLRNKATANRPFHPTSQYLSSGGYGVMVTPQGKLWKIHTQLCHSAIHLCLKSSLEGKICKVLDTMYSRCSFTSGEVTNPHKELYRVSIAFLSTLLFGDDKKSMSAEELDEEIEQNNTIMSALAPTHLLNLFPILLKFSNKWRKKILQKLQAKDNLFYEELNKCLTYKNESFYHSNASVKEDGPCGGIFAVFVKEMIKKSTTFHEKTTQDGSEDYNDVFSFKHLQNTAWGLKLAGVDTTAAALEWIVLLMAGFPEVQKTARQEIHKVLGFKSLRLADRLDLHYIQAVLCECLRLGSFVGLCPPHVSDTTITVEGYTIPKGTPMIANLWAVHHDPQLWPEPNTMKPERFLDQSGQMLPMKNFPGYMPYSHGWRPCIGAVVSRAFLFLFLVTILQRFDINLVGKLDLEGEMRFGMNPKPYQVIFTLTKTKASV